jgi:two-component system, chemotaxis family, chemotaxis protein CheY
VEKKILIIEDEYDVASTMELALEMENYEVRHCADAVEGLSILASESLPDLIISDIMMPRMDGYQFTKMLRTESRYNHIPLILASAGRIDKDKLDDKAYQGFIRKPFDLDYFLDVVKVAIIKNPSQALGA